MDNYLLLCDWGNSSFRLALYNKTAGSIIDEIQSQEGIAGIYRDWQTGNGTTSQESKEQLYRQTLLKQIETLAQRAKLVLDHTPVLISGMASSSIGIADIPYAQTPFLLDGSQANTRRLAAQHDFPHEIILISGVQDQQEVMRGEETQLIGICSLLGKTGMQPREAILVFPGTHSKHIASNGISALHFKTFMTGEMFALLASHSILKDSVNTGANITPQPGAMKAFRLGVQASKEKILLNSLFSVRTNQLFRRLDKAANTFYLSGLLIGSELEYLQEKNVPLFLCSGERLFELYKTAMEELGLAENVTFISPALMAQAAASGQQIIYDHYLQNKIAHE